MMDEIEKRMETAEESQAPMGKLVRYTQAVPAVQHINMQPRPAKKTKVEEIIDLKSATLPPVGSREWALQTGRGAQILMRKSSHIEKGFQILIKSPDGKKVLKELVVHVKLKKGDDAKAPKEKRLHECYVTVCGLLPQDEKATEILKTNINNALALASASGYVDYMRVQEPNTKKYDTEIARFKVLQPYDETRAATVAAIDHYIASVNSTGLAIAEVKDDLRIDDERDKVITQASLEKHIKEILLTDSDTLQAMGSLHLAVQEAIPIVPVPEITLAARDEGHQHLDTAQGKPVGSLSDLLMDRRRASAKLYNKAEQFLPTKLATAIMNEVNNVSTTPGEHPLTHEEVRIIAKNVIFKMFKPEEYQGAQGKKITTICALLAYSLGNAINKGIEEGKAYPTQETGPQLG